VFPAVRLTKDFTVTAFGWKVGVSVAPGWLSVGIFWEVSPICFALALPFLHLWVEQSESDLSKGPWQWGWSLARLTIWKTEFRLDLDLNDWTVGVGCAELNDFSVHLGPFNVQIETDKFFAEGFPPGVPTLRLFFPPGRSVIPWPPRCRCCPPSDRLQCDDVTDFADDPSAVPVRPSHCRRCVSRTFAVLRQPLQRSFRQRWPKAFPRR